MNKEQALQIVLAALAQARLTKQEHIQAENALKILLEPEKKE